MCEQWIFSLAATYNHLLPLSEQHLHQTRPNRGWFGRFNFSNSKGQFVGNTRVWLGNSLRSNKLYSIANNMIVNDAFEWVSFLKDKPPDHPRVVQGNVWHVQNDRKWRWCVPSTSISFHRLRSDGTYEARAGSLGQMKSLVRLYFFKNDWIHPSVADVLSLVWYNPFKKWIMKVVSDYLLPRLKDFQESLMVRKDFILNFTSEKII